MRIKGPVHLLAALLTTFLGELWPRSVYGLDSRLPARLIAADSSGASSSFGTALAVSGDWLAAGDNGHDAGRGTVWLFNRNAGGADNWGLVKQLTAPDAQSGDFFGFSLALDAEWLVVGATGDDQAGASAGRLHLFRRHLGGADNWGHFGSLSPQSARAGDGLGQSVALQGSRLVAGAMGRDQLTGTAFAFEFSAEAGGWVEAGELAPGAGVGDRFGAAVDLDGDLAVVGARGHDQFTGAAWLFRRHPGGWEVVRQLRAVDAQSNDQSASTVALRNGVVAMGSRFNNEAGTQAGAVYLFAAPAGGTDQWGQWRKLLPPLPRANGQFGWSVAWAGNQLLVGAPAVNGPGAVWWYRLDPGAGSEIDLVRQLVADATPEGEVRIGGQVRGHGHEVFSSGTIRDSGQGRVVLHRPAETSDYSVAVQAAGPLLHYRFEHAHEFPFVRDASGQGRHAAGQELRPDSYSAAVPLGSALCFAGGTAHVRLPVFPDLAACTLALWVKPRMGHASAFTTHLLAGRPTESNAPALLLDEQFRLRLDVPGNDPASVLLTDGAGAAPGWLHLVVVYDAPARRARAYRNGRLQPEVSFQTALPLRLGEAWLGRHPFAPTGMTGYLDEVAVYAYGLDAGTVGAHHALAVGELRLRRFDFQGPRALLGWTGGRAPFWIESFADLPAGEPAAGWPVRFPQSLISTPGERAFLRVRQPAEF